MRNFLPMHNLVHVLFPFHVRCYNCFTNMILKHLFSTCCVAGTVLGIWRQQIDMVSALTELKLPLGLEDRGSEESGR